MTEQEQRLAVSREAISWIGTRYHDEARVKIRRALDGTVIDRGGVDCAQVVYAVYLAVGLIPAFEIPRYSPQWMLHHREEKYLNTVLQYAQEVELPDVGDLVLYLNGKTFSHGAIIIFPGWPNVVHAEKQAMSVVSDFGDGGSVANLKRRFFTLW
jgi:hypothetical protein